jgi:hypothetical protein
MIREMKKLDMKHLQRAIITVDSRSRENKDKTDPSNYTIRIPPTREIYAANLVSAEIPNSQYVINSSNNKIDFDDIGGGTGIHTATVVPGSYNAFDLAKAMDVALNAALGFVPGFHFLVTYEPPLQKIRITRVAGGNFSLLFGTGANKDFSIALKIGFIKTDIINVVETTGPNVVNLSGENYVFLLIDNFQSVRTTENIKDVFAKIVWNVPPRFICYDSFVCNPIYFEEPIANLTQIRVRFVQQDGTFYDFNGLDHSFTIEMYVSYKSRQ